MLLVSTQVGSCDTRLGELYCWRLRPMRSLPLPSPICAAVLRPASRARCGSVPVLRVKPHITFTQVTFLLPRRSAALGKTGLGRLYRRKRGQC